MRPFLILILTFIFIEGKAQNLEPQIICYASDKVENTRVVNFHQGRHLPAFETNEATSTFVVEYTGFTEEAKASFQYAVDIWASIIKSEVPIKISATWQLLDPGVLGSAGSNGSFRNFRNAPLPDIDYPVALAEKLARRNLNSTAAADINANFSSGIDWYYGLDGNPPAGEYDLVSVVLHEIGHGLGISGSFGANVANQIADHSLFTGFPRIYDTYLYSGTNQIINRSIYDSQSSIYQVTTSGTITFNSEIARQSNDAAFPPIFSPSPYNPGSSISHLDESTYPAGDPNSLMTPQIGQAEAIHSPGDIIYGMMIDMGWEYAFFEHSALTDTEDESSDLILLTSVKSDMSYSGASIHYKIDEGEFITEALNPTVNPDEFSVTLPNSGASSVTYFFTLNDEYGRMISGEEYQFDIGPDTEAPTVLHEPITSFRKFGNDEFPALMFEISDNIGIASAELDYSINDGPVQTLSITEESIILPVDVSSLAFGDVIKYRVRAEDSSSNSNQTFLPESGDYEILVIDIITDEYSADFAVDNGRTFRSDGQFSIDIPENFSSVGYHSSHPYPDENEEKNYYLTFLGDIILGSDIATLRYKDIALIEPGLTGSNFGSGAFYDFVALEGSANNGSTWVTIVGYDATYSDQWLDRYNESIENGNSLGAGDESLFESHEIELNDFFAQNSIVKLRFRIYANSSNVGWGWALKNFEISRTQPLDLEPVQETFIYPNPIKNNVQISEDLGISSYEIFDIQGRLIQRGKMRESIGVNDLKSGRYFLILKSSEDIKKRLTFIKK